MFPACFPGSIRQTLHKIGEASLKTIRKIGLSKIKRTFMLAEIVKMYDISGTTNRNIHYFCGEFQEMPEIYA